MNDDVRMDITELHHLEVALAVSIEENPNPHAPLHPTGLVPAQGVEGAEGEEVSKMQWAEAHEGPLAVLEDPWEGMGMPPVNLTVQPTEAVEVEAGEKELHIKVCGRLRNYMSDFTITVQKYKHHETTADDSKFMKVWDVNFGGFTMNVQWVHFHDIISSITDVLSDAPLPFNTDHLWKVKMGHHVIWDDEDQFEWRSNQAVNFPYPIAFNGLHLSVWLCDQQWADWVEVYMVHEEQVVVGHFGKIYMYCVGGPARGYSK